MDLLIYNKDHWYDTTTDKRRAELDKLYPGKFDSRYRRGDIVEVREDDYFKKHGFNKDAFAVVKANGVKENMSLMEPQENLTDPDNPVLVKMRRYHVDMTAVTFNEKQELTVSSIDDASIYDKADDIQVVTRG